MQVSMKEGCRHCGHLASDHVSLWNSEILGPIAKNGVNDDGPGKNAFKKLKILLDRMMLRCVYPHPFNLADIHSRTKIERADDLGLPPRTIDIRRDFFSPPEKEVYLSLFTNARRQFNTYLDHGEVLNNYSNIFSLITRSECTPRCP
jgi:DNA repair protein RAD16